MYNENSWFIVGDAKSPENNPITKKYSQYFLSLVVDSSNGKIIDCECSSTLELTKQFVKYLFIGYEIQNSQIEKKILTQYHGSSQKALIVAFRDAKKKYNKMLL